MDSSRETVDPGDEPTEIADQSELLPGALVGEYEIERLLGEGGMGRVYAAVHPVIAKRAAIKVLRPELSANRDAIARFIQEARSVNQIGHANIVDIFSFGTLPDGRSYFVMELLRGESLRDRLARDKKIGLGDTLAILETITLSLEAAHEHGIVHRDLKPDNVFLVHAKHARPQVKLLDFGIAKLIGTTTLNRTQTGHMLGTPAYVSPEQARGENVDHRTDIYALGAMAFEVLTGQFVFPASNAADMIAKQLYEPPRAITTLDPSIPPPLAGVIDRMLAKDPDARPTLAQIRDELEACRVHRAPSVAEYSAPPNMYMTQFPPPYVAPVATIADPRSRSRKRWVIAATSVLVLGIAIAAFATRSNEATPEPSPREATPTTAQPATPGSATPVVEPAPPKTTKRDDLPVDTSKPSKPPEPPVETTKPIAKPQTHKRDAKPTTRKGSGTKPLDPDAPM